MENMRVKPGRVAAVITARGGSKGIPGKNLRPLRGKPLIFWTVEAAVRSTRLDRILVSTDSEDIAQAVRKAGSDLAAGRTLSGDPVRLVAEVPFLRPAHLGTDTATHIDVLRHALEWLARQGDLPEYVLTLQPTSPLRTAQDIDSAIGLALSRSADAVVGAGPLSHHPSLFRSVGPDGELVPFLADTAPNTLRQEHPPVYAINGAIYVNRSEALLASGLFCPPGALAYVMPGERSLDIDEAWQFTMAESLLTKTRS